MTFVDSPGKNSPEARPDIHLTSPAHRTSDRASFSPNDIYKTPDSSCSSARTELNDNYDNDDNDNELNDSWDSMASRDITRMMSEASLGPSTTTSRDPFPSSAVKNFELPHLLYEWKDENRVSMVTVEVHLPAATIPSEFHLELQTKGGRQALIIKHTVSPVFLDADVFKANLGLSDENAVVCNSLNIDASAQLVARSDYIEDLKRKYSEPSDLRNLKAYLTMRVPLPFICDDIFDLDDFKEPYKNTGFEFRTWSTTDDQDEEVICQVLQVTLRDRKRERIPLKSNTPQRKVSSRAVFARKAH